MAISSDSHKPAFRSKTMRLGGYSPCNTKQVLLNKQLWVVPGMNFKLQPSHSFDEPVATAAALVDNCGNEYAYDYDSG